MTLLLVKKDLLLAKKQIIFMLFVSFIIPLFVVSRVPSLMGAVAFIYTVVFTELIILQAIAAEEAKYPKAAALICAAPYSRKTFVKAKYVLFLFLFAYCYAAFSLVGAIIPGIGVISLSIVLAVLFFGIIIYGVYLPLYFKFGFEKTRFFFTVTIFVLAFGAPMFATYFNNINFDFSVFFMIPAVLLNLTLFFASVAVLFVSMSLSIKIYTKKEL